MGIAIVLRQVSVGRQAYGRAVLHVPTRQPVDAALNIVCCVQRRSCLVVKTQISSQETFVEESNDDRHQRK